MKVIILTSVVLLFAACGGRGKAPVNVEAAGMVVELSDSLIANRRSDTIAFGRLRAGELATREFTVKNVGDKALVITRLDLSCGCVQADYSREPLMPGQEAPMTFTLDTHDLSGWVFKTIIMRTSSEAGQYTLCVTADVTAE